MSRSKPPSPISPLERSKPASALQATPQVSRTQASSEVQKVSSISQAQELTKLTQLNDLDRLSQVDQECQKELNELIKLVDQGARTPNEAWEEVLLLALTSSLNVPLPVARGLVPQLKSLIESDPEAGRALKERLGVSDSSP